MDRPFRHITYEPHGSVVSIHLIQKNINDADLEEVGAEVARLLDELGFVKLVLSLGPEEPNCLYSVFLAKLLNLKKRLEKAGGGLALANVSPHTRRIFQIAGLEKFFQFYSDETTAVQSLQK